ncbi:MAG: lysophospholipid acyltransferase family protein, partial [Bacteroidales bacterium]|nr:lysophospholipid acyltransferase family protein [Bacteroidales bacterium]
LAQISNLKECFIPVDNFSAGGERNVSGIRSALEHISSGGALGLFPAGEVATWQKGRVVEDKPWSSNIMKLVRYSGLPVVPIYFDGGNSRMFHLLGRIHPMLRTVRLVREMINKKGTTIKVRIGKPVSVQEMAGMDARTLGAYLRNRCYALESQCVPPKEKVSGTGFEELAPAVDPVLVRGQMEALESKVLFQAGDYKVYLIDSTDAPDALRELYRLREETFRSVGEGTGRSLDTDGYDSYFKHLILWNIPDMEIAGAYRVGYGSRIMAEYGQKGFYSDSMVRLGPDAGDILPHSMELGRSFIACKYQKEVMPLKLMLTGLAVALAKDPEARCCLGTVSISDRLPDLYKSLAVYFIERDFKLPEAGRFATPSHPFQPDFLRVDPEGLLQIPKGDIDAFDRLIWNMSEGRYRLPVLLRKYFSCGAKVACFNVDPLFCNSLDGMIVLKVSDFPPAMLRSIVRPLSKEMQEKVFMHFYGTSNPEG